MFTRKGTEYDAIDKGLATGAFSPWSSRLRKLRKELGADAARDAEHQQRRGEAMADYSEKKQIDAQTRVGGEADNTSALKRKLRQMGLIT